MRKTFRAKRIDNGEWVEGYYVKTVDLLYKKELHLIFGAKSAFVFGTVTDPVQVDPETLCQCTGYEGVFEKDIFQFDEETYVIEWDEYSLGWNASEIGGTGSVSLGEFSENEINIIGNMFDDPELMEVQGGEVDEMD